MDEIFTESLNAREDLEYGLVNPSGNHSLD